MIWAIVLVALGLFAWWIIEGRKDKKESEPIREEAHGLDMVAQPSEPEVQQLRQSYYRFAGAVASIRGQENIWKSDFQYAQMQVTRRAEGCYHLRCNYEHDGNSGVYAGLRNGSYIQYPGMDIVEDGFRYELDGVIGDESDYSLQTMISCFQERNLDAVVEFNREYSEETGESSLYVKFVFR